jgi:alpha-glucosidase
MAPFSIQFCSSSAVQDLFSLSTFDLLFWGAPFCLVYIVYWLIWQRDRMPSRTALALGALCATFTFVYAQSATATITSYREKFTVPADADASVPLLPNIYDPEAVNAQEACPGYLASTILRTEYGLTANLILAGPACNAYGTDVETLNLTIEYQSDDRLHIEITPSKVDATNSSWFILPEALIPKPGIVVDANITSINNDLGFAWSNDPTFGFTIIRQSTGDVLFDTTGSKLVYENQFIEFVTTLPDGYNLYGMGEVIHGLRMGNNFTRTFWAADVGGWFAHGTSVFILLIPAQIRLTIICTALTLSSLTLGIMR